KHKDTPLAMRRIGNRLSSMRRRGRLPRLGSAHDEDQRYDDGEDERQNSKELNERNHDGLLAHHAGERDVGRTCGTGKVHAACDEASANLLQKHASSHIERADVSAEDIVLRLSIAAE